MPRHFEEQSDSEGIDTSYPSISADEQARQLLESIPEAAKSNSPLTILECYETLLSLIRCELPDDQKEDAERELYRLADRSLRECTDAESSNVDFATSLYARALIAEYAERHDDALRLSRRSKIFLEYHMRRNPNEAGICEGQAAKTAEVISRSTVHSETSED